MLFSCTLENTGEPGTDVRFVPYRVTVNGAQTKASLNEDTQYIFAAGDRLFVNYEEGGNVKMHGFLTLISGIGGTTAEFQGDLACEDDFTPESTTPINVTLLGAADRIHSISNNKVETSYQANQFAGSFAGAVANFSDFTATSTFGATSFTLNQQSSFLIFQIRMTAEEAPQNRVITAKLYSDGNVEVTPLRTAEIEVSETGSVPFVLAFEGGEVSLVDALLRLEWTDSGSVNRSKDFVVSNQTLAANHYYTVSRSTLHFDGFRIKAKYDNTTITFNYNYVNDGIEYSLDYGETWNQYSAAFTLNAGQVACIKGNRPNYKNDGGDEYGTPSNKPIFTANSLCYISGNIMSLLQDKENLVESAFQGAFSKGKSTAVNYIDIDPDSPLILPATTLASKCYMQMFRNCTSLTRPPQFRVEGTAYRCCYNMFRQCSSLSSVQGIELPAMVLAEDCYRELFRECTNLSGNMPILPAPTLVQGCYQQMFSKTKATTVTCLATDISASNCTSEWLSNVDNTDTHTFYRASGIVWPRNPSGIPSNWAVIDY